MTTHTADGERDVSDLTPLVDQWCDHMRHLEGLSDRTIKEYRRQVVTALPLLPPIDKLTAADVRALMLAERERGLSPESVNQLVKALNSFLGWASDNQSIAAVRQLPKIRAIKRTLPRALSPEQCQSLIDFELARGDWLGLRNAALWTLMWATGVRITEALSFTIRESSNKPSTVILTGKGGKQRMVPILPIVWSRVHDYLEALAAAFPAAQIVDDTPLFVTKQLAPFQARDAERAFVFARDMLELPLDATPHCLRHSFATQLLDAGGAAGGANLRDVQSLLGHSSISTTSIYTQVANAALVRQYDAAHPRGGAHFDGADTVQSNK